jgi:hypothetical protein
MKVQLGDHVSERQIAEFCDELEVFFERAMARVFGNCAPESKARIRKEMAAARRELFRDVFPAKRKASS